MMSRILGAPLGGTIRGGHHGLESVAFSLITPPNGGGGAGIWFPLIVVVALGSPNVPVTTCAEAPPPANKVETASAPMVSFRKPALKSIHLPLVGTTWFASVRGRNAKGWSGDQPMRMLCLGRLLAPAPECKVGANHVPEIILVAGVVGPVYAEPGVQVIHFRRTDLEVRG